MPEVNTTKIGLISDTHVPDRCRELPGSLNEIFRGLDLIIHAGDVGDLRVLRHLETLAPVVAVHGNDEPQETKRSLPAEEPRVLDGIGVLVIHGHDSDPEVEGALRRDDSWRIKLDYWSRRGVAAGADVVVFGHTHVPMAVECNGVALINPGAFASGSFFHRQTTRTVAIFETDSGTRHVDVDRPNWPVETRIEPRRGFAESLLRFHQPMYDEVIIDQSKSGWIRETLYTLAPEQVAGCVLSLSQECWFEGRRWVTAKQFLERLLANAETRPQLLQAVRDNHALSDCLPPQLR